MFRLIVILQTPFHSHQLHPLENNNTKYIPGVDTVTVVALVNDTPVPYTDPEFGMVHLPQLVDVDHLDYPVAPVKPAALLLLLGPLPRYPCCSSYSLYALDSGIQLHQSLLSLLLRRLLPSHLVGLEFLGFLVGLLFQSPSCSLHRYPLRTLDSLDSSTCYSRRAGRSPALLPQHLGFLGDLEGLLPCSPVAPVAPVAPVEPVIPCMP